jgi:hypothetical protein
MTSQRQNDAEHRSPPTPLDGVPADFRAETHDAGLTPLSAYEHPSYRPRWLGIAALLVTAVAYVCSMPLEWAGVITPSGAYSIVNGFRIANWVLGIAAVVLVVAVRLIFVPPGSYVRALTVALDVLAVFGVIIEYFDNLGRAESLTVAAYFGPGYFVAFAATALLIVATVLCWRDLRE